MGREHDVREIEKRGAGPRRLGLEDVQSGGKHMAGNERLRKGSLVDEAAAGRVHDDRARLELQHCLPADQSARLVR